MRAMHKGVFWAYATAPHDVHATVKVMYHVPYRLPSMRARVVKLVAVRLRTHAYWRADTYSSWYLAPDIAVQGMTGMLDMDFGCLTRLSSEA